MLLPRNGYATSGKDAQGGLSNGERCTPKTRLGSYKVTLPLECAQGFRSIAPIKEPSSLGFDSSKRTWLHHSPCLCASVRIMKGKIRQRTERVRGIMKSQPVKVLPGDCVRYDRSRPFMKELLSAYLATPAESGNLTKAQSHREGIRFTSSQEKMTSHPWDSMPPQLVSYSQRMLMPSYAPSRSRTRTEIRCNSNSATR